MRSPRRSLLACLFFTGGVLLGTAPAAADPSTCVGAVADLTCASNEPCTCDDCFTQPKCGGCVDNGACLSEEDACTCADCAADPFCSDITNCENNGECAQFTESCLCDDCAGKVPNCGGGMGGSGGSTGGTGGIGVGGSAGSIVGSGGTGGSGNAGGSGGTTSGGGGGCGCTTAGSERGDLGAIVLAAIGAVVTLRRRRRS